MANTISCLFCAIFLFGCGEWRWVNNYPKRIGELDFDLSLCERQTFEKFPLLIIQQQQYNYLAAYHNQNVRAHEYEQTDAKYYMYGNTMQSTSKTYKRNSLGANYIPEYGIVSIDVNKNVRDNALRQCMISKGWELKYFNSF